MHWSWASGRTRAGSRRKKSNVWPRCGGSILTSDSSQQQGVVMPSRLRIAQSSLVIALLAATPPLALAQRMIGPDPNRDPRLGVYVRDSAVAGEKLALAER